MQNSAASQSHSFGSSIFTLVLKHGKPLLSSAIMRSLRKVHHSLFIKDGMVWLCHFTNLWQYH